MSVIIFLVTMCIMFVFLYKKRNQTVRIRTIVSSFRFDNSAKKDFVIAVISGLLVALATTISSGIYSKYRSNNPSIKIKYSEEHWFSCELDSGERCMLFGTEDVDTVPCYTFDIQNNSEKSLYFNDGDSVYVNLLEFIPYDDLIIVQSGGGADGWNNPTEFELNMSTKIGEQIAIPFEDGRPKTLNGGYISIDANQMDRFMLKIFPEEKGYYRFTITLNYQYNNKTFTEESKEYKIVCDKGLKELSKQRPKKNDSEGVANKQDVTFPDGTFEEVVDGQWLISSEETYNCKGYIIGWKDYVYNENNRLHKEIKYDIDGKETVHIIYTYDENGNIITKKVEDNFFGSGWSCDNYDVFDYDEYGNLIQKSTVDNDNEAKILWYYTYIYQDGLLCTEQYHSGDGNDHIWNYTYDNDGNIILIDKYYEIYDKHSYTEYVYENGLMVKKHSLNFDDSSLYVSYQYDKNGHLIRETVVYGGSVFEYIDYEYDAVGNQIKKIYDDGSYTIYKYIHVD